MNLILISITLHNYVVLTGGGFLGIPPAEVFKAEVEIAGPRAANIDREDFITMNAIREIMLDEYFDHLFHRGDRHRITTTGNI